MRGAMMQSTSRRRLLQLSGAGALSAASGGLAGILASGRAPAFAQGTALHWVRGSDYVPVSDQMLRTKILEQCQKDLGIKFNLETVDGLTIQARVTSAVSSGTGPDIISAINNWAQLYADSVADVSDVAEEIGKAQGGFYETSKAIAFDGKKWIAVPNTIVGLQIANRASWWNEIGYGPEKYPETWEEWRQDGKTMRDDIFHTPLPKGPAGQLSWHVPLADMVMGYGKNQKAAKDFLRWFHSEKIYEQWWVTQQGFSVGPTKLWENHKLWQEYPIMLPFRAAAESGHFAGYAGPANRKAAEVISKYIISDMYAKAVQGMAAEEAVKSAHAELVKIYS